QTIHGSRQAELGLAAAELNLEKTRQEVMAQAAIAYQAVLLSMENLTVIEESLGSAEAHLKLIQDRFDSGFTVKSDLLRAQVRIADLEQERYSARSQVDIARAMLNDAMGEPLDSAFELTSASAAMEARHDSLAQWTATALDRRPDYLILSQQTAIAEEEIQKATSAHLPSFNLFGNYELNSEDFEDSGTNYTVGAMMRINLYSGGRDSARTRETRAALKEIRAMQRSMASAIQVETHRAFSQAESAWKRIEVARAAVSQAEEGLRIVANRYQNGLLTIVSLLDAEVALQKTRQNCSRAFHDYNVALTRLNLAAGTITEDF
ncbi:MAG TPA: TolC family protein, partial [Desulfosarcina sp.]|nr:TolC family protein [Desulfosarcina sp.]